MKKEYTTPSMEVIKLQQAPVILAGSYDGEINAPLLLLLDADDDDV